MENKLIISVLLMASAFCSYMGQKQQDEQQQQAKALEASVKKV